MPDLRPFLVLGLALGGVFALSGVGLVVLYRATGVLNLAYGAVGALGSLIAWSLSGALWGAVVVTVVAAGLLWVLVPARDESVAARQAAPGPGPQAGLTKDV